MPSRSPATSTTPETIALSRTLSATASNALHDQLPDGIAHVKVIFENETAVDLFCLYANPAYSLHLDTEEIAGKYLSGLIPGYADTHAAELAAAGRIAHGGAPEHFEVFDPSLNKWLARSIYGAEPGHVVFFLRDTTQARTLQASIKQRNERLELALSASNLGAWDYEARTQTIALSESYCDLIGYAPEDAPNTLDAYMRRVHPQDVAHLKRAMEEHFLGESEVLKVDFRFRHGRGHWIWLRARGKSTRDARGNTLRLDGTAVDISSRRRLSEEGLNLVRRFETMLRDISLDRLEKPTSVIHEEALEELTRRQKQVLKLIAQGLTSPGIAKKLGLAVPTVVSHRSALMQKLGLHSTADITRFAMRHGLLEGEKSP